MKCNKPSFYVRQDTAEIVGTFEVVDDNDVLVSSRNVVMPEGVDEDYVIKTQHWVVDVAKRELDKAAEIASKVPVAQAAVDSLNESKVLSKKDEAELSAAYTAIVEKEQLASSDVAVDPK